MGGDGGVERELKLQLQGEQNYEKLCAQLPGFVGEELQQNSYWDLPDYPLTRRQIMLRLRIEGQQALITVKRSAQRSPSGVFEAAEDEAPVDLDLARKAEAGTLPLESLSSAVLTRLAGEVGTLEGLCKWGELRNVRRRYRLPKGAVVEVDRSDYPEGHTHWEVEVEGDVTAHAQLKPYLDGIQVRPQTLTKSERLARYSRLPEKLK